MRIALAMLAATALLGACAPGERLYSNTPHPPVVGTEWRGRAIDDAMVMQPQNVTMILAPDGQISGNSGCNHFTGQYQLNGRQLRLTAPLASTRLECPPTIMEQERHFLRNLGAAREVSENPAGFLVLSGDAGALLRFEAVSGAATPTGAPMAAPPATGPATVPPAAPLAARPG